MKRNIALKIAAAEAGVTQEVATKVIETFTASLVLCPVCEGDNRFIYRQQVTVPTQGSFSEKDWPFVEKGKEGNCPLCGPAGKGDPDWLIWHCRNGHGQCQPTAEEHPKDYETCGWIVTVPYEK